VVEEHPNNIWVTGFRRELWMKDEPLNIIIERVAEIVLDRPREEFQHPPTIQNPLRCELVHLKLEPNRLKF